MNFKTGNRIIQTGNGIIYPIFRPLIKKLLLQSVSHFYRGLQNWFLKQEMELFKQEMELFLPLSGRWSKNYFYKNFLISTKEFKIDFQNRKRNYLNKMELFIPLPALWSKNFLNKMFHIFTKEFEIVFQNRKWNYLNRKWNYFSHFQAFDQKTTFTKSFSFPPWSSK